MTANQSRLLGVALLLSAVGLSAYLARLNNPPDDAAERKAAQDAIARRLKLEESYARSKARLDAGAYIAATKRISDSEEIQTIVIPEGYTEELDTRCIVYKNAELRTSSISCTGINFRQPVPPS